MIDDACVGVEIIASTPAATAAGAEAAASKLAAIFFFVE